jgi:predicted Rossmann fold flavoprotein
MSNNASHDYDVIILGAGAAGLLCAITAANRGRRVLVLEKANKIGKKILMSGGGRCNFTNRSVEAENFISNNPHFCKSALSAYTPWDFIALVEKHGIEYEERRHSQLFCRHSAQDILTMLVDECELACIEIKTHCDINRVEVLEQVSKKPHYRVVVEQGLAAARKLSGLNCQSLVVASGALSVPSLGGSGFGYKLARQFSLPLIERRAGLVPFMFTDSMKLLCARLSGSSLEVEVRCNGQVFIEQLLFTHRGISGPAILQISNYWRAGDEIRINLSPATDVSEWLLQARQEKIKIRLKTLLRQKLAKSLVNELEALWWPRFTHTPIVEISATRLRTIGQQINDWRLKPSATEGYRTAEVTLGGVDTDAISSRTMEVKAQAGLYFVGEVLDVSGHLGGFNFQWAWSSGYVAGQVA